MHSTGTLCAALEIIDRTLTPAAEVARYGAQRWRAPGAMMSANAFSSDFASRSPAVCIVLNCMHEDLRRVFAESVFGSGRRAGRAEQALPRASKDEDIGGAVNPPARAHRRARFLYTTKSSSLICLPVGNDGFESLTREVWLSICRDDRARVDRDAGTFMRTMAIMPPGMFLSQPRTEHAIRPGRSPRSRSRRRSFARPSE